MTDATPQYPSYPETEDEHFDQVSPLDGVQEQPDGTLAPANPVHPAETPPDMFVAPAVTVRAAVPVAPVQYTSEFQDSVNEQLAQQRAQLAQPAGNVDIHGAPHFQRVMDGVDLCGQCGESWPCEGWQKMAAAGEAGRVFAPTPLDAATSRLPIFEQAAAAIGITPEELARLGKQAWGRDS